MQHKPVLTTGPLRVSEKKRRWPNKVHTSCCTGEMRKKAAAVQQEIISSCGQSQVDMLLAGPYSLTQVHQLAAAFTAEYDWLDVLITNAEMVGGSKSDGAESAMNRLLY